MSRLRIVPLLILPLLLCPGSTRACVDGSTTMCLNGDRFRLEVDWTDFQGHRGPGRVVLASGDSGVFWFFDQDNWEMLVKVLDGCAVNDHFWVFAAATTNVEYTLRVTDETWGLRKEYVNPLGNAAAAVTDTTAFDACQPLRLNTVLVANPSTLSVHATSTITIIPWDADSCSPLGAGARIRLIADGGTIDPEEVFTDSTGRAVATFVAGSQAGTATVTAVVGGESTTRTLTVRDGVATIALVANPTTISPHAWTDIDLVAVVRNSLGDPLGSQGVFFASPVGMLSMPGPIFTNSAGEAHQVLSVGPPDLVGLPRFSISAAAIGEIQVTAEVTINVVD